MKTAIVYDRVNKWGGAERVLLTLHEMFPEAPLFTAVYSSNKAKWAKIFPQVTPSFLQRMPLAEDRHEYLGVFTPIAFESFDFEGFDLVISVTSEAAKGIITRPPTKHICYCLTPTRYLWSHYDEYFKNPSLRVFSTPFVSYLRYWDKIAAYRPDEMIAISTVVQKRIKKYYSRNSKILFPPVEVGKFSKFRRKSGKHYLLVSRLVAYKKIDLVVKAFNILGLPIVIVGTGSEEKRLKRAAKENIRFEGFVSEDELSKIYSESKALVMPQEEDFGIVAVEAQASGVPVIAYKKGGVTDTLIENKTGIFFDEQNAESLVKSIKSFENNFQYRIKSNDCVLQSQKFTKDNFKTEFTKVVRELRPRTGV